MIEDIAEEICNKARADIIANYNNMGLRASGSFEKETKVVRYAGGVKLVTAAHAYYMENGRKAGKQPPRDVIQKWIRDKGIQLDGINEKQLAYLICRKIGRDGIKIPNKFNSGGVISSVINDELRSRIKRELLGSIGDFVINNLKP